MIREYFISPNKFRFCSQPTEVLVWFMHFNFSQFLYIPWCVENSFWKEDCKKCVCQFGKATCKPLEKCRPNKVKVTPELKAVAERVRELLNDTDFLNSVPTIPPDTPYELTCIPGEVFRISCDFCQCRNDGIPYCQNKYCPEKQNNTQ
ncbi:uncharacterized protein LOC106670160 isoform X1 [Cimex lectularius]|uniref:Pacifastin domain-containing protein n=1 Tax=Cimex lectularius TaxID=79782 RepID=A0A8I6S476_CIMLE|nr:uncharacterized protein LOC106670160 isoform X1 [Cimex lectularius]